MMCRPRNKNIQVHEFTYQMKEDTFEKQFILFSHVQYRCLEESQSLEVQGETGNPKKDTISESRILIYLFAQMDLSISTTLRKYNMF